MKNCISKRGYIIDKNSISTNTLQEIKRELIAKPLSEEKYNTGTDNFNVYIETVNNIHVPKMYGIQKFGPPMVLKKTYSGKPWGTDHLFRGALLEHQHEPVSKALTLLYDSSGCVLNVATGQGKTFMLINILSVLKKKCIIVVNKITLMEQWVSEIKNFLPTVSVGTLQGKTTHQILPYDITISMLQSLARVDYPSTLFDDISICVVDEVHNISTNHFSKVLFKLCSEYTIGLSATPQRSDGCEYVFKWHIGDLVYHDQSIVIRPGIPPTIIACTLESMFYKQVTKINRFTGQSVIQFTSMITELFAMTRRNDLVVEIIQTLMKSDPNRKILVLSDRRDHVKMLDGLLTLVQAPFTHSVFLGSMKIDQLNASKKSSVIIATTKAFGEGVSEKDLDTLILTVPKKFIGHIDSSIKNESGNLEQIIGRIFRKKHIDRAPLIIDLQDHFSVYKNQSSGRNVFYKRHFPNGNFVKKKINLDESWDVSELAL